MYSRIVAAAALSLPFLHAPATAQSLPNWSIAKICQQDSAPGQCRLFEQRARARVAEAWLTLPSSIQKGCAAEFKPPLEPSWRVMADCIGELGVVARVNVRKSAIEREKQVVTKLRERREKAEATARREAERKAEAQRQKREAAADKQRVSREEQSFLAALEAERAEERRQRIAAEQRAQELEEQRLAAEEASFLKELAASQKRERLARAEAEKAKAQQTRNSSGSSNAAGTTTSSVQTASAASVGLLSGSKAVPPQKDEKPESQKTLKVTLPAQPAKKAIAKPVVKQAKAKPRSTEVAVCEDRLKETAQAGSVLFAFDSAELLAETELTLRALSAAVRACGRLKVTIEGHTDATGRIGYNQRLSERRAQNVANYLINAGAKSSQVSYIGYGEKRPVASNRTSDGRAKNRRIEYTAQ